MGWLRIRAASAALVLVFASVVLAGVVITPAVVAAQPDAPSGPVVETEQTAVGTVDIVRDDDTSATVQRIRRNLVALAGLTALGLAVYVWHTSPRHRLDVASRRAADDVADG